ncbi:MAG TPA: XRE family transcriptional regulator [Providencia sp.]|uniref:helix-turn-helix domain-containing protein n=1 Tax=unclassified Providencia TaxID=2633465 RepID=UPI000E8FAC3A|nr:helix-turn-helix transcriptional regulator [Providencia sp.]MBP6081110.1 helix-turn-helix transcriptional regulator [Providencia sp.]HBO24795.1 XRE family transcriptional regulator [Providencia sp.]
MFVKKNKNRKPVSLNEAVGRFVRESRSAKSLTGAEFGKLIHVSQQQISRYENGICGLNIETLENILIALDIEWQEFYRKVLHIDIGIHVIESNNK